jgi:hypothetical protein
VIDAAGYRFNEVFLTVVIDVRPRGAVSVHVRATAGPTGCLGQVHLLGHVSKRAVLIVVEQGCPHAMVAGKQIGVKITVEITPGGAPSLGVGVAKAGCGRHVLKCDLCGGACDRSIGE